MHFTGITCQLQEPWRQEFGNPTQGQRIAQILNAQPLGLNEQQGEQLVNQISQEVLQNIGSTAQIQNFDSPGGISQRFGSFAPSQLLPQGVVPLGFADGSNRNIRGDTIPINGNPLGGSQTFPSVNSFGEQGPPGFDGGPGNRMTNSWNRQQDGPFTGSQFGFLARQENINAPGPLNAPFRSTGLMNLLMSRNRDLVPEEIHTNSRLRNRLELLHDPNLKSDFRRDGGLLEEISRENRRLRKLIRQKKRRLNNRYEDKEKPKKKRKNGGLAAGLVLGALGALVLG